MSKFIRLTMKSTGLPLVMNANLIETMIPLDGYTSIRTTGMPFGEADHVLETIDQIEAQSLRDEFAKAIATGLSADEGYRIDSIARMSYKIADQMLKERSK